MVDIRIVSFSFGLHVCPFRCFTGEGIDCCFYVWQTTRLYACWERAGVSSPSWHEIARPQVHGHDLNCLAVVKGPGNQRYVSGADEKVARVFEAPGAFLDSLYAFTGTADADGFKREDVQIVGANMSALGLSQKPIYTQGTHLTTSNLPNGILV